MSTWLIDPKDIHDNLEDQGLDVMTWLMHAEDSWASYRIIVQNPSDGLDFLSLSSLILSAFCEKARINLRRLGNGQIVAAVLVHRPEKGKPA
jgi:hypothetical protein